MSCASPGKRAVIIVRKSHKFITIIFFWYKELAISFIGVPWLRNTSHTGEFATYSGLNTRKRKIKSPLILRKNSED